MSATLRAVVLDCPDPAALAGFYASLLGLAIPDPDEEWVDLAVGGVTLSFQRVHDYEPPTWPDGVPQQAHLDLSVPSYAEAHDRALALGATPLDPTGPVGTEAGRGYRVYGDPAGHPFCLCLA